MQYKNVSTLLDVSPIKQPLLAELKPTYAKQASTTEPCPSYDTVQPQAASDQSLADIDIISTEPTSAVEPCQLANMEQPRGALDQSVADIEPSALKPVSTKLASAVEPCTSNNVEQLQAPSNQPLADVEPTFTEPASIVQPTVCMAQFSSTSSVMENHLDEFQSVNQRRARKRMRSIENWKKSLRKKHRNCGDEYITDRGITKARRKMKKGCGVGCRLNCHGKLLPTERESLFHAFWQQGEVTRQPEFIVKHCSKVPVRSRKTSGGSRRKFSLRYSFELNGNAINVCKQFFLDTLNINDRVVRTAFNKLTEFGTVKGDSRGAVTGRSNICSNAKQHVVDHINQFPRVESHYCRASSSRQYLEAGLSLSQMYRLYVDEMATVGETTVKEHMYRKIFNENFNLSFFTPKNDQCDTCFAYANSSESVRSENENEFHAHIERKEKARQIKK